MKKLILSVIILFVYPFVLLTAQTPAFPGAEGHGRYTTGGRGGAIYYVTTLDDNSEPGSFRYAVTRSGARTVLFSVSGTIQLKSELKIKTDNLTIAGQSAPGDGICIAGYPLMVQANNVIVRYIRCRMGDAQSISADGADTFGGRKQKNVIIDHCSVSWSTDECASFYENENFTMQWCLISESLRLSGHSKGAHGYGGIWGGAKASFHHNLLAHHSSRTPRLAAGLTSTSTSECVDVRNNVYYNYDIEGAYGGEAVHANLVNNYYQPGPANQNAANSVKRGRIFSLYKRMDGSYPAINDMWGTFYISGNVVVGHANATKDNWTYGVYNQFNSQYGTISQLTKDTIRLSEPLPTDVVTTHSAEKAYEQTLLYAGCSLHRDALDERIASETRTNTAAFIGLSAANTSPYPRPGIIDSQNDLKPAGAGADWSPWPELVQTTPPADTNNDGIPDGWLETNYPDKSATDLNEDGYTFLEVYLNSLVAEITAEQNNGGITSGLNPVKRTNAGVKCYVDVVSKSLMIEAESAIRQIDLFNVAGHKVYAVLVRKNTERIDLSGFLPGIYIVKTIFEDSLSPNVVKIRL
ncbi:MAG: Pectate trisaccharide-lyase [Candidatus Ordinivivax streblomastigis]|uniref:Pectate trisaccharide-lyase n=1 Tax=Candidatus Ordinivivax streblomastigis TaxID=2540710 RepID=A0A5M8NZB1_9BACT|nr:MAG: Pectate trisaccharide-lyase [Candidatus Ordinivivax streblomastigis]